MGVRALAGVWTGFFVYCVAVQLNDSDAALWVAIYALPAVIWLAVALVPQRVAIPWKLPMAIAAVALAASAALATRVVGQQDFLESEEGRETLGLLIVCISMGLAAAAIARRRSASPLIATEQEAP